MITTSRGSSATLYSNNAKKILLGTNDTTWSAVWDKISTLSSGESATFYAVSVAYAALSGNARSTVVQGVISRAGSTDQFEIIGKYPTNRLICARIAGASSVTSGTYEEVNYSSLSIGSSNNPLTSLDDVPLNTAGNLYLEAAISPTGSAASVSYWKYGSADTRYAIMAVHQNTGKTYVNSYANSAFTGWKELITDRISVWRDVSTNRKVTFTVPSGSHALVMIGTTSTVIYMTSQNVMNIGNTLPTGFTASNSGTSVTITGSNDTAYVCSVIIIPMT